MSAGPGAHDPIGLCRRFLAVRDLSGCRKYALMARESDPNSRELAQILAIVDVLLAAERRVSGDRPDYYSILQLTRPECETGHAVLNRFKKLVMLVTPSRNKFPFSDEAFKLVCDARSVLSKPEKKKQYDLEITDDGTSEKIDGNCGKRETHLASNAGGGEGNKGKRKGGTSNEREQKDETFWTVCPYCCVLYEYAKAYEERCLRCQNCRRAFHGMPVGPLPPGLAAEGMDKYYCRMGFFGFGHPRDGFFCPKKNNGDNDASGVDNVMEISDDSDPADDDKDAEKANIENGEMGMKAEVAKQETRKREGMVFGRLNGRRVKTTARNTRKGMRMALRKIKINELTAGEKSCRCDKDGDNPEFFQGN